MQSGPSAVRRLARQGILYVDRTPPTPSTSQLHHRLSTSLALPLSAQPSDPQAKQRASSWAALSLAGRSLFAPRDSPPHQSASADSSSVPLPTHEGHAAALITELRLPHPDPHRVWSLFSQLEMAGTTYTLPPISLHSLLKAIHIQPKSRRTLDVHSSTGAARAYAAKVEIVRLRILQSKGTLNRDDFNASLKQQAVFKYAPGVCKAWDELIEEGVTPTVDEVKLAFQTMLDWIEMHEKDGGRTLGRMAARPLVAKIMTMLEDLEGESKQTDVALDYFFQIVLKARNLEVFTLAMKTIYGFDIKLPGADFDVGGTGLRRQMGEAQVCWTLEMLSEMGDMSGMLAVFEVCDSPSPALLDNTYFGHSFHPPPDSTASIHPPPPTTPHLIGTHAHSLIIHAASRMGHGAIARMYMNQLYWRWQISSDARLVNIERAVGITYEKKAPGHDQEVVNVMEGETFESEVVQTETSSLKEGGVIPVPLKHYFIPSSLIHDLIHYSKLHYDAPTARYVRSRTMRILQLMGQHTNRFEAVLSQLEITLAPSTSSDDSAIPLRSLKALQHEVAYASYHRLQLRTTFDQIKIESNIVASYTHLRRLLTSLSYRIARLLAAQTAGDRNVVMKLKPGVKRKEMQVRQGRILVARQRLVRLKKMGGNRGKRGKEEWDGLVATIKALNLEAAGRGEVVVEEKGEETVVVA